MKIYDQIKAIDAELEPLRDKYVPDEGKADTVGGEIIRAMDRIIYRYYNDGDKVGRGYGITTCDSSYSFLCDVLGDLCPNLNDGGRYESNLMVLIDNVNEYLKKNPAVFRTPNEIDSRVSPRMSDYYDYDASEDYDYDEPEW